MSAFLVKNTKLSLCNAWLEDKLFCFGSGALVSPGSCELSVFNEIVAFCRQVSPAALHVLQPLTLQHEGEKRGSRWVVDAGREESFHS